MREHPILFSGPMVRAILSGTKSQTRRIVKPQPPPEREAILAKFPKQKGCPYGQPGDRLWVRETLKCDTHGNWHYAADNDVVQLPAGSAWTEHMLAWAHHKDGDTCVSIHMPRWASRITLEITGVRVERLQDISHRDALAEGVDYDVSKPDGAPLPRFQALWDKINGKRAPWASNPWTWVLSFKRVAP